jgi:agmatine deiminase
VPQPHASHRPAFRVPAEWEPHAATWIAWPQNREDWPGKFEPIPWVVADIVRLLATSETVRILVKNDTAREQAADVLDRTGVALTQVDFVQVPTDRIWTRDFIPTFRLNRDVVEAVSWRFNGWAKYDDCLYDTRAGAVAAQHIGAGLVDPLRPDGSPRIVLEGGAIDYDGHGTLLTTEECLLSPIQERNPGMTRADYELALGEFLGIDRVLWLGQGIAGDDTHGHVDDLARFTDPHTIVVASEDDPADANFLPLKDNHERLRHMVDFAGRPYRVVKLPMPRPVVFDGARLPASYANFYIANGLVLVPTFNDPADRQALEILQGLFADRQVVGIHARDLVWGLGTIHCMTHEEPAAPPDAD